MTVQHTDVKTLYRSINQV